DPGLRQDPGGAGAGTQDLGASGPRTEPGPGGRGDAGLRRAEGHRAWNPAAHDENLLRADRGDQPPMSHAAAILLARTPIRSTSASIRSPTFRKLPLAAPTPSGVPVAMTSPGARVKPCERTSMHWATGKIILAVVLCWRVWPFTRSVMASAC